MGSTQPDGVYCGPRLLLQKARAQEPRSGVGVARAVHLHRRLHLLVRARPQHLRLRRAPVEKPQVSGALKTSRILK